MGEIATGLGPGAYVRFVDIDGDGMDDYIFLHRGGRTTIYQNVHSTTPGPDWRPMPGADASGISKRPEEIGFADVDSDGQANYVWTNDYPNLPTWRAQGEVASGVSTAGSNARWTQLQATGRAAYIAVDPGTGALAT